jgi:hypothetical protein
MLIVCDNETDEAPIELTPKNVNFFLMNLKNDGFLSNYEFIDVKKTLERVRKLNKGDGDVNLLTNAILETTNLPGKYMGKKPSEVYSVGLAKTLASKKKPN